MGDPIDKVSPDLDNPVDAWILSGTARLLPLFRATGHTPNMITTYSFLCGLGSVEFLRSGSITGFAILYAIAYVFDCLDGQFARRYHMTSRFGDLYDHVTDLIVYALVGFTVYQRCPPGRVQPALLVVFGCALIGLLVNIGCQQRLQQQTGNPSADVGEPHRSGESLDILRVLCPCDDWVRWSRYLGYATFNILTVAFAAYLLVSPRR